MKKVSFLLISALLTGLFVFSACTPQKKEIYIQLYSVRDDIKADYEGTIAKVAEMGYTGVEAASYGDGKF